MKLLALRMSNTFQTQVASIVEMMAKAVLAEMSKVSVEGSATLCFEMSNCHENESPKVKLPVMESETRMVSLSCLYGRLGLAISKIQ